jgi:Second Messenger Oligonucleotide or Dinucleotide Synthetase domain
MIAVPEAFDKFKSRLELTEREQADASRRHQEIREYLGEQFEIDRDFLTGSYARWTKTKPLKDVDIFFVLGNKEREYRDKHPNVVLEKFLEVLTEKYRKDQVSLGRRSVQVDFGVQVVEDQTNDQIMSVDVVPAFAKGSHYEIPDRTTGAWMMTDPEIHADLATKANKAFSGEWKPLVKMIKKWNQTAGKPVKPGFLLEVIALELFVPEFSGGYPYELKGFFATAADHIKETWGDPAKLGPAVSDQMDEAKASVARGAFLAAEQSVTRAIRLAKTGHQGDALEEWRNLFGPLFPLS